jgi:hypothetical protein
VIVRGPRLAPNNVLTGGGRGERAAGLGGGDRGLQQQRCEDGQAPDRAVERAFVVDRPAAVRVIERYAAR